MTTISKGRWGINTIDTHIEQVVFFSDQDADGEECERFPVVASVQVDYSERGSYIGYVNIEMIGRPTDLLDQIMAYLDDKFYGYDTSEANIDLDEYEPSIK